jgi:hypothetical protein
MSLSADCASLVRPYPARSEFFRDFFRIALRPARCECRFIQLSQSFARNSLRMASSEIGLNGRQSFADRKERPEPRRDSFARSYDGQKRPEGSNLITAVWHNRLELE